MGFRLGTAPAHYQLDNMHMIVYRALQMTPNIDCYGVRAVSRVQFVVLGLAV